VALLASDIVSFEHARALRVNGALLRRGCPSKRPVIRELPTIAGRLDSVRFDPCLEASSILQLSIDMPIG
jgi:hypothetical protein